MKSERMIALFSDIHGTGTVNFAACYCGSESS
jgi:hypothetical protein